MRGWVKLGAFVRSHIAGESERGRRTAEVTFSDMPLPRFPAPGHPIIPIRRIQIFKGCKRKGIRASRSEFDHGYKIRDLSFGCQSSVQIQTLSAET